MAVTHAIAVNDLAKRFGKIEAVRGVTFEVRAGTTTALLGGNGAGKTTTLSMLLGVLLPTAGSIHVLGCDMLRERHRVLPRMNFTSPYVDLPKRLTVRENLRVFADLYGIERPAFRIGELAAELDLSDLLKRPYGQLSAGQRTRVSPIETCSQSEAGCDAEPMPERSGGGLDARYVVDRMAGERAVRPSKRVQELHRQYASLRERRI